MSDFEQEYGYDISEASMEDFLFWEQYVLAKYATLTALSFVICYITMHSNSFGDILLSSLLMAAGLLPFYLLTNSMIAAIIVVLLVFTGCEAFFGNLGSEILSLIIVGGTLIYIIICLFRLFFVRKKFYSA